MKSHRSMTILLVEDEEAHARLIERNLKRSGLINEILWLQGGQAALDLLFNGDGTVNQDRPDPLLMLLDLNMPGVNGFQVLNAVKSNDTLKGIPVIILTTTDSQEEINQSYHSGANAYVTKPVELRDFVQTVRDLGLFLDIVMLPEGHERRE